MAESWVRQQYITQSIINPLTQRAQRRNVLGYSQEGRAPVTPFTSEIQLENLIRWKLFQWLGSSPPAGCLLYSCIWDKGWHFQKLGNLSRSLEKNLVTVAIPESAIAELIPSNIHSGQERAESIRRLLVIYLVFLESCSGERQLILLDSIKKVSSGFRQPCIPTWPSQATWLEISCNVPGLFA